MNLFITCRTCKRAFRIQSEAKVRGALPGVFSVACPRADCPVQGHPIYYTPQEVFAQAESGATAGGAAVAGVLGALVAGPLGAVVGAMIGGAAGNSSQSSSQAAAEVFNNS